MAQIFRARGRDLENPLLKSMFEARKRVFVDLLGWDLPVFYGRYEMDQFDDDRAVYLIVGDSKGEHLASTRLLETERPHLLDTLFAPLCPGGVPTGPGTREITRFCLSPAITASGRLSARNALVSALVQYALRSGIDRFTGVAEMGWLQQILAFGWRCRPLGPPARISGRFLGALEIEIEGDTPDRLADGGIFIPQMLRTHPLPHAA